MKKIISSVLAICIFFSVICIFGVSAKTQKEIEAEIKAADDEMNALQNSISTLNAELKEINAENDKLEKEIADLRKDITDLTTKIAKLESSIASLEEKIRGLSAQIDEHSDEKKSLEARIKECEDSIANAEAFYENERDSLKKMMRATYESGLLDPVNSMGIMLNSSSLGDYLNKLDAVKQITERTKAAMEKYKDAMEDSASLKKSLENIVEEHNGIIISLEADSNDLESNIKQLEKEKEELAKDQKSLIQSQASLESKSAKNEELKATINSKLKTQKAKLTEYQTKQKALEDELEAMIIASSGGGAEAEFIWPLTKKYVITSTFMDPEYHAEFGSWHKAIDVGGSKITGTDVYASKSGTVKQSAYQAGGAGNYVTIDHGNNQISVYYHLNDRSVKAGDKVKQGQVIGHVGNTGNSTGPHLHFGIKINGEWVDPLKYVSSSRPSK